MTDKELLELAAKAAGIDELRWCKHRNQPIHQPYKYIDNDWVVWNPLEDDGDALRLAVKLGIDITFYGAPTPKGCDAFPDGHLGGCAETEPFGSDPFAATRRAIVRAAAEIGRNMG